MHIILEKYTHTRHTHTHNTKIQIQEHGCVVPAIVETLELYEKMRWYTAEDDGGDPVDASKLKGRLAMLARVGNVGSDTVNIRSRTV